MDVLVRLNKVSFGYPRQKPILENVNFSLTSKEKSGLIGPNGSGKTTLLFLIVGILKPIYGKIILFGQECQQEKDFIPLRPKIGFVFQNADDQLIFPTVIEDVAFGPLNLGYSNTKALEIAQKTLEKLNISHLAQRNTFNLSGGEKKLVSLATVLAMSPQVLLLDEPTTGLDEHSRQKLISILNKLDLAYLIISHDYDFLARTTQKQYVLKDKQVIYDPKIVLHPHLHAHPLGYIPHKHSEKS